MQIEGNSTNDGDLNSLVKLSFVNHLILFVRVGEYVCPFLQMLFYI